MKNININEIGEEFKKNKKSKIKKDIFAICILLITIILGIVTIIKINDYSKNLKEFQGKEEIKEEDSLKEKQKKLEENFNIKGYTIENPNVIVNPYEISPLTAIVIFDTKTDVAPRVTIKGRDENSTIINTFETGTTHILPIYGLYADTENIIIIEYENVKKEIKIKTDKLPENIALPEEVYANKEKLGNEFYFFTPSSLGYTVAYDVNGDVRWYLKNNALWKIDRLNNGHMLLSTERLINPPYYTTGLYEIDMLGKIYVEYSLSGGYHHDYFELDNGNLLIATNDFSTNSNTVEDIIIEMDRSTGNIIRKFDLKDILKMTDGKSENWTEYDWFHNNSVWYDKNTNSITLSGRHQDAVINIDYQTGKLNWIIGDSTNWSNEYRNYFFKPKGEFEWQWSQHAAMITPEGYVFLLDNGNNKSKIESEYVDASNSYTRGVMYKIDTNNMTIEQVWQYGKERGSNFYSPYISDVDYIEKNHYIVHSGGIVYKDNIVQNKPAGLLDSTTLLSDTVEILDNNIIFEIKLPTNNYRVEKMNIYTTNENLKFKNAKSLGTLGKTEVTEEKNKKITANNKIKEIKEKYGIDITRETDRMVVKGTFNKLNKVNIIFYKDNKQYIYNVIISKKPYTALCVDVFNTENSKETEDSIAVTKYINNEGLKGKYLVYIEIDGIIYDTMQYIDIK